MTRLRTGLAFGAALGLLGLLLSLSGPAREYEAALGLGTLFGLRGVRVPPANVVVVSADRASAEELGVSRRPDKWPRSLHARLVDSLVRRGARVVVFDMYFTEPGAAEDDARFAAAMHAAGNVVLATPLQVRQLAASSDADGGEHRIVERVEPLPELGAAAAAVAPFVLPGLPVRVHRYWTFQPGAGDAPTFPVVALQLFAAPAYDEFRRLLSAEVPTPARLPPASFSGVVASGGLTRLLLDTRELFVHDRGLASRLRARLGGSRHDDAKGRLLTDLVETYAGPAYRYLNHYGPAHTVQTVSYAQALQEGGTTVDFRGAAVFVGVSQRATTEREDHYFTVYSEATGMFVSGVEIAATAFANLLEDAPVRPIAETRYAALLLTWGLFLGLLCRGTGPVASGIGVVASALAFVSAAAWAFRSDGTWYPLVVPLLVQAPCAYFGALSWRYFEVNRERSNIRDALGHYVPDDVVQMLARDRIDATRGGQTMYGVCLFSDLAGYTSLSERLSPRELSELMHRYFEAVFEPIKEHGGLVIALEGDAILAVWKGAAEEVLHARVCRAALGIAAAVQRFGAPAEAPRMPTRIGVHAGQLFLGNIGAGTHYTYNVAGDTVNTASRLENLNKILGTSILVSDAVARGLEGFLARPAGTFLLKGKAQPVGVHELLCRVEDASPSLRQGCALFSEALNAFRSRRWDEAQALFERVLDSRADAADHNPAPDDPLARFYLRHCEEFRRNPPPPEWDAAISTVPE